MSDNVICPLAKRCVKNVKKFRTGQDFISLGSNSLVGYFSFTLDVEISVNSIVNHALVEHKQGLGK